MKCLPRFAWKCLLRDNSVRKLNIRHRHCNCTRSCIVLSDTNTHTHTHSAVKNAYTNIYFFDFSFIFYLILFFPFIFVRKIIILHWFLYSFLSHSHTLFHNRHKQQEQESTSRTQRNKTKNLFTLTSISLPTIPSTPKPHRQRSRLVKYGMTARHQLKLQSCSRLGYTLAATVRLLPPANKHFILINFHFVCPVRFWNLCEWTNTLMSSRRREICEIFDF